MSSDLSVFDCSFFSDPFFPFTDPSIDVLQTIPLPDINHSSILQNPFDELNNLDQIASAVISSSSPPNHQTENLSLCPITHLQYSSDSENQRAIFSDLGVKTENFQLPLPSPDSYSPFGPHCYGGSENAAKMMQRSFSSNCFDGKTGFLFHPHRDSLAEYPHFHPRALNTHENHSFSSRQMRRVLSTGDLVQKTKTNQGLSSSPSAAERVEESSLEVGRYSAEVRKERIHRYRAKRTQRNFNKTIKYACRKTLADNRVRVRGRFARNEETGEVPCRAATLNGEEEEDDLWIEEAANNGYGRTAVQHSGTNPASASASALLLQYYYGC